MICSASSDWVTLTQVHAGVGDSGKGLPQTVLASAFSDVAMAQEDWGSMGYTGRRCTETGIRYGTRYREGSFDEMLVASGPSSDAVLCYVPPKHGLNCTRLDLQVTAYFDHQEPDLAASLYAKIMATKAAGASMTGRRATSLVQSDTGSTLYVGKRGSGRKFFRLYDKSIDFQGGLGTIWRQEVQYGRKFAQNALEWYLLHRSDMSSVIEMINGEFYGAMGYFLAMGHGVSQELIPEIEEEGGTIEGKLKWIKRCVSPSVAFLVRNGYGAEALAALGLANDNPELDKWGKTL